MNLLSDNDDEMFELLGVLVEQRPLGLLGHSNDESTPKATAESTAEPCRGNEISRAASDLLAERRRQVEEEGFTPQADDQYTDRELADAAACYAAGDCDIWASGDYPNTEKWGLWPWPDNWWKPSDRRRNLVKAGALILAEIERLDRIESQKGE